MLTIAKNTYDYRELMVTIAWRNIALRYKQARHVIASGVPEPATRKKTAGTVASYPIAARGNEIQ